MEVTEFDATLGGTENLPFSVNSLKFAASRSVEIAAMTESILRPSKTKLIFQTLPVHMRRRVMSHNSKRLPRKLREGHMQQLKKSGLPPKQKRPSRKYRRRPANLLEEYNRRQKNNTWLETHIWHAKRFHMINRWGHRLAKAPCDKAFRACYRATSAHCLLQDISYYTPIQLTGPVVTIKSLFSHLTNPSCGLGITAKAYIDGNREGVVHLYRKSTFPNGYIGKINFIWLPGDNVNKTLWLFIHPSQVEEVKTVLNTMITSETCQENGVPNKRQKLTNQYADIKININSGLFNRFRLTGPNSHAILTASLKCVNEDRLKSESWITDLSEKTKLFTKEKEIYWDNISTVRSPSQLPAHLILGLIVKDPRLSRPNKRTKAKLDTYRVPKVEVISKIPPFLPISPLWDTKIHSTIKEKRLTNGQFIEHVTKTQLVPGEVFEDDPVLQTVPVILIQRPGSQDAEFKKIGYGSGWDIILPAGYGLQFLQTFVMFGARCGGLRETESLTFEMGECYLPPDSNAGKEEEKRIESEMRNRYFRLPPSKRVNYTKLAINTPFICPWQTLLKDWGSNTDTFFILRDKKHLELLYECINIKKPLPPLSNSANCLVAVYLQMKGKGSLKRHALICLPHKEDYSKKTIFEPHREDPNEKLRKQKRAEHVKDVKRWRRQRIKLKKTGKLINKIKHEKRVKHEPSDYVKAMRELWLPSNVNAVRHSASREVIGYLSQGAFSFTEAQSCGIGYIAYNALNALLQSKLNQVLVRNTSSRVYRLANIKLIR